MISVCYAQIWDPGGVVWAEWAVCVLLRRGQIHVNGLVRWWRLAIDRRCGGGRRRGLRCCRRRSGRRRRIIHGRSCRVLIDLLLLNGRTIGPRQRQTLHFVHHGYGVHQLLYTHTHTPADTVSVFFHSFYLMPINHNDYHRLQQKDPWRLALASTTLEGMPANVCHASCPQTSLLWKPFWFPSCILALAE